MNSPRSNNADANHPHLQPSLVVKPSNIHAVKEYSKEDIQIIQQIQSDIPPQNIKTSKLNHLRESKLTETKLRENKFSPREQQINKETNSRNNYEDDRDPLDQFIQDQNINHPMYQVMEAQEISNTGGHSSHGGDKRNRGKSKGKYQIKSMFHGIGDTASAGQMERGKTPQACPFSTKNSLKHREHVPFNEKSLTRSQSMNNQIKITAVKQPDVKDSNPGSSYGNGHLVEQISDEKGTNWQKHQHPQQSNTNYQSDSKFEKLFGFFGISIGARKDSLQDIDASDPNHIGQADELGQSFNDNLQQKDNEQLRRNNDIHEDDDIILQMKNSTRPKIDMKARDSNDQMSLKRAQKLGYNSLRASHPDLKGQLDQIRPYNQTTKNIEHNEQINKFTHIPTNVLSDQNEYNLEDDVDQQQSPHTTAFTLQERGNQLARERTNQFVQSAEVGNVQINNALELKSQALHRQTPLKKFMGDVKDGQGRVQPNAPQPRDTVRYTDFYEQRRKKNESSNRHRLPPQPHKFENTQNVAKLGSQFEEPMVQEYSGHKKQGNTQSSNHLRRREATSIDVTRQQQFGGRGTNLSFLAKQFGQPSDQHLPDQDLQQCFSEQRINHGYQVPNSNHPVGQEYDRNNPNNQYYPTQGIDLQTVNYNIDHGNYNDNQQSSGGNQLQAAYHGPQGKFTVKSKSPVAKLSLTAQNNNRRNRHQTSNSNTKHNNVNTASIELNLQNLKKRDLSNNRAGQHQSYNAPVGQYMAGTGLPHNLRQQPPPLPPAAKVGQQQEQQQQTDLFSFFKGIFSGGDPNQQASGQRHDQYSMGQRGRQSAETKASSSQSAINAQKNAANHPIQGFAVSEALEKFGNELTEFEKVELQIGIYDRIYTIGTVRRDNQYSIADQEGHYLAQIGEQLGYRYEIIKLVDQGAFGQVVKCIDRKDPNQKVVAAKIGKNKKFDVDNANVEVNFLQKLKVGSHECSDLEGKNRIVEFLDSFKFRQHIVIVFEMLHFNLYKYIKCNKQQKVIFQPEQIRGISHQIAQGLKYMENHGIIHCDMKPENVLFTDDTYQSIKIIDFGSSCKDCQSGFFYVQSRYYRAPEIVLGTKYGHAVDMWSLGCIVYELITGRPLFPGHDENEMIEYFVVTIGDIPQSMLTNAKKYKQFFKKSTNLLGFEKHEIIRSKDSKVGDCLDPHSQTVEMLLHGKTTPEVIDFICKCVIINPEARLTPQQALNHPWFQQSDTRY